jgi:hypothetical protein
MTSGSRPEHLSGQVGSNPDADSSLFNQSGAAETRGLHRNWRYALINRACVSGVIPTLGD